MAGKRKLKKQKPLTPRERRLVYALTDPANKTTTDALRAAGFAESTIKAQAKRTVGNSRIQKAIAELMEERGLTDERLLDVLSDGLKANKVISAMVVAAGGTGMADAHSMTKDFVEVEDHFVRHKFLDTALKLKGSYPVEKKDPTGRDDPNTPPPTKVEIIVKDARKA
jgi:phage terminase small subunit